MTGRAGVLLMTVDPKVAMAVGKALASNGHVLGNAAARDPRELATQLQTDPRRSRWSISIRSRDRCFSSWNELSSDFQGRVSSR